MFCVFIPVFQLFEKGFVVASIEAPLTLLQEPIEVVSLDAVEATQVPLGLVPEVLNPVDVVLLIGKEP